MKLTEIFQKILSRVFWPEAAMLPVLVVLASATTLAIAHGFEYIGNIRPCALCLEQRSAYWAAIGFGVAAALLYRQETLKETMVPRLLIAGMVLALGYGAYTAGFHTGVEAGWWEGPASCTSTGARSLEDMLKDTAGDIVMCDEVPWALFGISIAGYNFLIALSLTIYAAVGFVRALPKRL